MCWDLPWKERGILIGIIAYLSTWVVSLVLTIIVGLMLLFGKKDVNDHDTKITFDIFIIIFAITSCGFISCLGWLFTDAIKEKWNRWRGKTTGYETI